MPTSRVIVVLYAFAATVHVLATAHGPASLAWATAPLLMPLLAGVVIFAATEGGVEPSRLVLGGLALATVADLVSLAGTAPATEVRIVALLGGLACYAVALVRARIGWAPDRFFGLVSGFGLVALSIGLLAVRLNTGEGVLAAPLWAIGAYTVGQALIVTGWIRRPATAPPMPRPRTPDSTVTRTSNGIRTSDRTRTSDSAYEPDQDEAVIRR